MRLRGLDKTSPSGDRFGNGPLTPAMAINKGRRTGGYIGKKTLAAVLFALFWSWWAYAGAADRPELVKSPVVAAATCFVCLFLLALPLVVTSLRGLHALSPAVMGGLGYLIWIGIGGASQFIWPGYACNPSLFNLLPFAMLAQTVGALCFIAGTITVKKRSLLAVQPKRASSGRLMTVFVFYAAFALYVGVFAPRASAVDLRATYKQGGQISELYTVAPLVLMHIFPMIVAVHKGFPRHGYRWLKRLVTLSFGYALLLFFVLGSRTYTTQTIIVLFIAVKLTWPDRLGVRSTIALLLVVGLAFYGSTLIRTTGISPSMSVSTISARGLAERSRTAWQERSNLGWREMQEVLKQNLSYHLNDNQTMAMLLSTQDSGVMYGRAAALSLGGALPRRIRSSAWIDPRAAIDKHFNFYKEPSTDIGFHVDWQITPAAWGFADFGWIGLILYPFVLGILLQRYFRWAFVEGQLGPVGWLAYLPLVNMMWNPHTLGPTSLQELRLIALLALAIWWTTQRRRGGRKRFDTVPGGFPS